MTLRLRCPRLLATLIQLRFGVMVLHHAGILCFPVFPCVLSIYSVIFKLNSTIYCRILGHEPQSATPTSLEAIPDHCSWCLFDVWNDVSCIVPLAWRSANMPSVCMKLRKRGLVTKHDIHPLILRPVFVLPTKCHSISNVLGA